MKCEKTANEAIRLAKEHGVPVRPGKNGYNKNNFIRIGIRKPENSD